MNYTLFETLETAPMLNRGVFDSVEAAEASAYLQAEGMKSAATRNGCPVVMEYVIVRYRQAARVAQGKLKELKRFTIVIQPYGSHDTAAAAALTS